MQIQSKEQIANSVRNQLIAIGTTMEQQRTAESNAEHEHVNNLVATHNAEREAVAFSEKLRKYIPGETIYYMYEHTKHLAIGKYRLVITESFGGLDHTMLEILPTLDVSNDTPKWIALTRPAYDAVDHYLLPPTEVREEILGILDLQKPKLTLWQRFCTAIGMPIDIGGYYA